MSSDPILSHFIQRFLDAATQYPDLRHVAVWNKSKEWPTVPDNDNPSDDIHYLGLPSWPDYVFKERGKRQRRVNVSTPDWFYVDNFLCQGTFHFEFDPQGNCSAEEQEKAVQLARSLGKEVAEWCPVFLQPSTSHDKREEVQDLTLNNWLYLVYYAIEPEWVEKKSLQVWHLPGNFFSVSAQAIDLLEKRGDRNAWQSLAEQCRSIAEHCPAYEGAISILASGGQVDLSELQGVIDGLWKEAFHIGTVKDSPPRRPIIQSALEAKEAIASMLKWANDHLEVHNPIPNTVKTGQEPDSNENDESKVSVPATELSQRQILILQTLFEATAFNSDRRINTDEIAERAEGPGTNPAGFKEPVADLHSKGFIKTKTGRGGGCWLSQKGLQRAEEITKQ